MQAQICPRCKFRLTTAKAICNTCGYVFQSGRKAPEPATAPAPRPTYQQSQPSSAPAPMISSSSMTPSSSSSSAASMRKAQATAAPSGPGNFWRTFFGLDPLPTDKDDALGET